MAVLGLEKRTWIHLLVMWLGVFILTVSIPSFVMFSGAGFSEANLTQFFLYGVFGIISGAILTLLMAMRDAGVFENKEELKGFEIAGIHEPETTLIGNNIPFIKDGRQFIVVSAIVGVLFGFLVMVTGTFAEGIPSLFSTEASVHPGASLTLAVEPAVFSETLFFSALFFIFVGSIYYAIQNNVDIDHRELIISAKVTAVFLTTIAFWLYHNFRYGVDEVNQLGVILLGFVKSSTLATTGSIGLSYFVHWNGNLFDQLNRLGLFTDELAILYSVVVTAILLALYVVIFRPFR